FRHAELGEQFLHLLLARAVAAEEAAMRAEMGEQQVLLDREVGDDVLRAAVLGNEAEAGADCHLRTVCPELLATERDLAAGAGPEAEDRLDGFRAAGADQAAKAEDLALADGEGNVAYFRRRGEMADLERHRRVGLGDEVRFAALIDGAKLGAD